MFVKRACEIVKNKNSYNFRFHDHDNVFVHVMLASLKILLFLIRGFVLIVPIQFNHINLIFFKISKHISKYFELDIYLI